MEYVAKQGTTALGIIGTALGGLAVAGGSLLAANVLSFLRFSANTGNHPSYIVPQSV